MKISGIVLVAAMAAMNVGGEDRILRIDGSNGARPLFAAFLEAFSEKHAGVEIELGEGMTTSERLEALDRGTIHLASASHGIEAERLKPYDAVAIRFARMAVVFAVHESAGVSNLSSAEICSIYEGKITNWKAVRGPDLEIVRLMRPDDEVDAEVVRAGVSGMKNLQWNEEVGILQKSGEMAEALASTPGAIGVTTLIRALNGGGVKVVSLDGVHPGAANRDGEVYPLYRDFYVIVPPRPSKEALQFLNFVKSPEARKVAMEGHAEYFPGEISHHSDVR